MGYRSNGKLYMKGNAYNLLPTALLAELAEDWEKDDTSFEKEGYVIYSFYDWKWYESYDEVKEWNAFFSDLEDNESIQDSDWDFIVIGEDNAIVDHRTNEHLYVSSSIEIR
jgi:hypothetical protein